ncbi:Dynactin subunit 1, partial [Zootermopsis nevadensis]
TGFVETLKPQYIPGHAMMSPGASSGSNILEQLLEFKSRIMESQTSLQREVQRAKQEAREAIEARDTHAEEMADLAETVEMATLDKEIVEEK